MSVKAVLHTLWSPESGGMLTISGVDNSDSELVAALKRLANPENNVRLEIDPERDNKSCFVFLFS
jgi:hypothetical protein